MADVYLRTRQVRERYGNTSHMFIERRLANDKTFPKPVFFGRLRFWKLSDLEGWEKAQATRSGKARPARDTSAARAGKAVHS
jgi:predicted DNA-binding transcriptional regulator AlpA